MKVAMPYYYSQRAATELMNLKDFQVKRTGGSNITKTFSGELEGNLSAKELASVRSKINMSNTEEINSQNELNFNSTTEDQIEYFLRQEAASNVAFQPQDIKEDLTRFINFNIDLKCGIMPFLNLAHISPFGENHQYKLRAFWAVGTKTFTTYTKKKFLFFFKKTQKIERVATIYLLGSLDNISDTNSLNINQQFSHDYPSDPSVLTKTLLTELNYDQSTPDIDIEKLHQETVSGFPAEESKTPMLDKVIDFTNKASQKTAGAERVMPQARHSWVSEIKNNSKLVAHIHETKILDNGNINIFARPILIR